MPLSQLLPVGDPLFFLAGLFNPLLAQSDATGSSGSPGDFGAAVFLLCVYVGLALGVSFFCSLLEAGLLSSRTVTLTEKVESGSRGARILLEIKQHRLDDAISAILTLNTISNTAGAALAGNQFRVAYQTMENVSTAEGVASGIFAGLLTVLVLFFAEIPPKTLGAVYASQLAAPMGWALHLLTKVMAPMLILTRAMTRLLARKKVVRLSRGELVTFLSMATKEGALETEESKVFSNILQFKELTVQEVMTPRTVTVMVHADMTIAEFLQDRSVEPFSRIPVYREDQDHVIGYILQKEFLRRVIDEADLEQPISKFTRKIWYLPEVVSMFDALKQFLERREHMAIVTDEHGGVSGLVTLEDMVETILGTEIVDELDRHTDLQKVAAQLREARLERLRNVHRISTPPGDKP